jgi:TadE-like protein
MRGQAIAEFAIIAPVMLLIVLAIADFGRLFNSMVAVEAAAREASDYGTFRSSYWDASVGNPPITTAEMELRACTAAAGSHLEDYTEPSPAPSPAHAMCINPSFACTITEPGGSATDCASYAGSACSTSTTDPPCTVQVTLTYTFHPFFSFSLFSWRTPIVTFERVSTFRVSDLPVPS